MMHTFFFALSCGLLISLGSSCAAGDSSIPGALELGTVSDKDLKEISGLAASRRHPGILWVHNDGSNRRLFAVRTNGQIVAVFRLTSKVDDLEDIAVGPGPDSPESHLYIGDIGDNDRKRRLIQVLCLPEPELALTENAGSKKPQDLGLSKVFTLRYPDNGHDAEALMVDPASGDLFIVTKQNRWARVYKAQRAELRQGVQVPLRLVQTLGFPDVSAGDISAEGQGIILRSENLALFWARTPGETVEDALRRTPRRTQIVGAPEEPNGESVGFSADGQGYYTLSEGKKQPIYFFPNPASGP